MVLNGGMSNIGVSELRRSMVTSCRAVLLPRFGGPEVLELRDDVDVPNLKPNEVLVRARAVSVNPLDTRWDGVSPILSFRSWLNCQLCSGSEIVLLLMLNHQDHEKMRAGYGRSIYEPLLPVILGRDISGEIAAVGNSVRSLTVGQEVFGALHPTAVRGTYTEYAILAEDELTLKPESLSHVEASAIPFAALTAWRALRSTARIKQGQRVLVVGGGGAVGFSAIQLAVAVGCHVSTTCGGESIDRILAAGAEQAVDYTSEGEAASLADMYGLAIGIPIATAMLASKQIQYRFSHGIEYSWTYMRADAEGLHEIRRLSEVGKLKVPVEKTFPIAQVREAHEAKDKRIISGKVVLELD
ncbi:UNVERIFIED_CONTAM: Reticulon-4-interacting protein 1, mitochondrial [Sesamum radiatum]|uniref:Reticulon-4-interacting protein 1, mitochondrial n=1 Tax=Sesamum radiatum TaxID=300843 RepID=A0AAW2LPJ0_SESRA